MTEVLTEVMARYPGTRARVPGYTRPVHAGSPYMAVVCGTVQQEGPPAREGPARPGLVYD